MELRAHHLLCLLTFSGRGYTPAFSAEMARFAGHVREGGALTLTDAPDRLCETFSGGTGPHCGRAATRRRDARARADIGDVLGETLAPGSIVTLDAEILDRLRAAFSGDTIRSACTGCVWHAVCSDIAAKEFAGTVLRDRSPLTPQHGITAAILRHARETPDAVALSVGPDSLTWAALARAMTAAAAAFAEQGTAGKIVAVSLPNSIALVVSALGAIHAGASVALLDPAWPRALMSATLAMLQPMVNVTSETVSDTVRYNINEENSGVSASVEDTCGLTLPAIDTPFYIGFTSGSTGLPKGFVRHQRSWLAGFAGDAALFGFSRDDVVLAPGPLTHSLFFYALVRALHAGARVVLARTFQPAAVARLAAQEKASVIYGVPAHHMALADALERQGQRLAGVRLVLSSGAKFPDAAREKITAAFPRANFCEFYGTSELSYVAVADRETPQGSVGRAFPGVRITILDEDGAPLEAGKSGMVHVESPLIFMGYAGEAAPLRQQGTALSVGDIGRLDQDGFLYLEGRADRRITVAGKKIHPEAVEAALARHPAIAHAAVFGQADTTRGARLVAVIEPGDGVRAADLIAHARLLLAPEAVPRRYLACPDWPLTASGKTNFARLQALLDAGNLEPLP